MTKSQKNLRVCPKGHRYYKSSSCPVCPVCANEEKPDNFLSTLAAPARRALENAGISTLKGLAEYSVEEILNLHGIGPSTIPKLKTALESGGLHFKK